jgi:hypothetical protein
MNNNLSSSKRIAFIRFKQLVAYRCQSLWAGVKQHLQQVHRTMADSLRPKGTNTIFGQNAEGCVPMLA